MQDIVFAVFRRITLLATLVTLAGTALVFPSMAGAQARHELSGSDALYPRLVRLSNAADSSKNGGVIASVTTFPGGSGTGQQDIYSSSDNGASFTRVAQIKDPAFAKGLCCGTLYELPQQVGSMAPGTLLWAGSVGGDTPTDPMRIMVFKSLNQGHDWSYLSDCLAATVPRSQGGLWEPEFSVAANGKLICHFSDETVAGHSQLLAEVSSSDGITWSSKQFTVASGVQADRPGMAVVSKLPNGHYFMSFELCGPAACTAFAKTSVDGADWGDATNVGHRIETSSGQFFFHAPTNVWSPDATSPNGRLIVAGQVLMNGNGVDAGNGRTLFVNSNADGTGTWTTVSAPVVITNPPGSSGNPCQNYSDALLPSMDGTSLLELANDYANGISGSCHAYFATARIAAARGQLGMTASDFGVSGTAPGTMTITVSSLGGYSGTALLTVSIPGFPGTVAINPSKVTLNADGTAQAQLTATPTRQTASASSSSGGGPGMGWGLTAFGGGGLAMGVLGLGALARVSAAMLVRVVMIAVLASLAACGDDGGSTAGAPTHSIQIYQGTVTAVDSLDQTLSTQSNFKVTVQS